MKTPQEWYHEYLNDNKMPFIEFIKKVQDEAYNQAIHDLENSKGVFISDDAIDKLYRI